MAFLQSVWNGPYYCWNFMESGSESACKISCCRKLPVILKKLGECCLLRLKLSCHANSCFKVYNKWILLLRENKALIPGVQQSVVYWCSMSLWPSHPSITTSGSTMQWEGDRWKITLPILIPAQKIANEMSKMMTNMSNAAGLVMRWEINLAQDVHTARITAELILGM